MDVDAAKLWNIQDLLGQDLPEGCYYINVRVDSFEVFYVLGPLDTLGLEYRDAVL